MNIRRFFSDHKIVNKSVKISGDEFYHLKIVNRAEAGNSIEVIDGKGSLYLGQIRGFTKNEAEVIITKTITEKDSDQKIIIASSLLKKKKYEPAN